MEIDNRKIARERAEKEAKRADMKQHADKLIQGFEKLEDSHSKRAIWELFQNALDLSDNCHVIIKQENDKISFSHNGKPFDSNTLSCLIKQVSSKDGESNEEEVGQYGTGFITTHSFGKKIILNSVLKEGDYFIPIKNFEIDRIAKNSDELIEKLIIQQEKVFDLVENGDYQSNNGHLTTFTYLALSQLEQENINKAISNLSIILPYVMMLNDKLQKVTVKNINGEEIIYEKGKTEFFDNVNVTNIYIDGVVKKIYSLHSIEENITIILPLYERNKAIKFNEELSRLFLYYPLIGTEKFGFNFIIHSKYFSPTEPRDGIHLKSKNEQVKEKEENNRKIIARASEMIFDFVKNNAKKIENPVYFAPIYFNTNLSNELLSEYFINLKKEWVSEFEDFVLVETNNKRLSPKETKFFKDELLFDAKSDEEKYFKSIYSLVNLFWDNIPKFELVSDWTSIVNVWNSDNVEYISINDLVEKIQEAGSLDKFDNTEDLKNFYNYLIKHSYSNLFGEYRLLPNIKNEFRVLSHLNKTINVDKKLINIADTIIPDIPKRYIKKDFEFDLKFETYDRKQFSRDINSQISELSKSINQNSLLEEEILFSLIEYCKIFPSLDNTGTRGKLIKLIAKYYQIDDTLTELSVIANQEIDWLTPIKSLLRNFIWELNTNNSDWIKENISFIKDIVSVIYDYYEFNDIVQTLPIFPNQLYHLYKKSELKIDDNIPEELKVLYNSIVKPEREIKQILILQDFSEFLKNGELKTPKNLGDDIDKVFQEEKPYSEINEHPYKKEILNIIKKISDNNSEWAKYFPLIEEKKATIMMASISDDDTKNDLFSIIGLEKDKIALLGKLSRQSNFEEIIHLGEMALLEQMQNNADFEFKHNIGTHIEKIIREKLGQDLIGFSAKVEDEQGGQDIVIRYENSIIYFVEVKSRWDNRNSITMSPLQMKRAVENKSKYSLCCVEMSDYKIGDDERYKANIEDVLNRINIIHNIGERVEPLINGIIKVKDFENEISISGDYRGVIPQSIVKQGKSIEDLIEKIILLIKER